MVCGRPRRRNIQFYKMRADTNRINLKAKLEVYTLFGWEGKASSSTTYQIIIRAVVHRRQKERES